MHTLGLCVNGVFDRFPNAKVMIGHGGEIIPYAIGCFRNLLACSLSSIANRYNIWRTNHRLELLARLRGMVSLGRDSRSGSL